MPGALKNAFDSLGPEWSEKSIAFVSYGADNGIRAVEHWRSIVSNLHMVDVRSQLGLSIFSDFDDEGSITRESAAPRARVVVDDLVALTGRMLSSRA